MKKHIDQLSALLKQNSISLPQRAKNPDDEPQIEDDERCHALKDRIIQSKEELIDSGASNHMVSSKESFSTVTLLGGPSITWEMTPKF